MFRKKVISILCILSIVLSMVFCETIHVSADDSTSWTASEGFSSEQGNGQWYYQHLKQGTYSDLTWIGECWKSNETIKQCEVWQNTQRAGNTDSVRVWESLINGTITITGTVCKAAVGGIGGNGVIVTIKKNDDVLWGPQFIEPNDTVGYSHNIETQVEENDRIYFIVNNGGIIHQTHFDLVFWDPTVTLMHTSEEGETYYVDYENGNDTNDGMTPSTAWKHCPGDENATGVAAATDLNSGDTVLFRGGVIYRGTISSISDGVTYRGNSWPTGSKAIIDGSDMFLNEKIPCTQDQCGSNPNWANIVSIDLPESIAALDCMIFDETTKLWLAQYPKIPDPFWEDDYRSYRAVSPENITVSSIRDPLFFNQQDPNYWDGAYIRIWINPNSVATKRVTGYDPNSGTIYYEELGSTAIYGNKDQYFAMANHIDLVTQPGEYYIDEENHKMYLWPADDSELSLVSRETGFDIIGHSDLVFEGFVIQRFAGSSAIITSGAWMGSALRSDRLTIRNNEMRWIKRTASIKTGAITLRKGEGHVIENNYIHNIQRAQGIFATESANILVRNNVMTRCGYKGLWFIDVADAQVTGNRFYDNKATHGTDASIFSSKNILFADNIAFNSQTEMLSFQGGENLFIYNNVLLGNGENAGVARHNGDNMKGILFIAHNTILYSGNNVGLNCAPSRYPDARYIVKNNIMDGWLCSKKIDGTTVNMAGTYEVGHNIYTGLAWDQKAKYGWYLMPGEMIQQDLNLIFNNPVAEIAPVIVPIEEMPVNYMLTENSPALLSGEELSAVIPEEAFQLFPDYDFYRNIEGELRSSNGSVNIGAF